MNRLFALIGLAVGASLCAQQAPPAHSMQGPPKSPPATESVIVAGKTITISYNSPRVRGRQGHIFTEDGLISHDPHYPVWRAGANAATKLHTEADLDLGGIHVPKGDYTLFINIADPENWVLIVSKQVGEWGLSYDPSQDLGQTKMTMDDAPALVEDLRYTLKALGGNKGTLSIAWENKIASVQFTVQ